MNMPQDIRALTSANETHPARLPPTLLTAGATARVLGALALVVLLWLAVAWALQGGGA